MHPRLLPNPMFTFKAQCWCVDPMPANKRFKGEKLLSRAETLSRSKLTPLLRMYQLNPTAEKPTSMVNAKIVVGILCFASALNISFLRLAHSNSRHWALNKFSASVRSVGFPVEKRDIREVFKTLLDDILFQVDSDSGGYVSRRRIARDIRSSKSSGLGSLERIECSISGSSPGISNNSSFLCKTI